MRKVLKSYSEVAHFWANKVQNEGRYQSLHFNDGVIYSYGSHFPVGKHVVNKNGEQAVLLTTRTYSPTTAKHKREVSGASSHLFRIYANDVFVSSDVNDSTHQYNIQNWIEEVESILPQLQRARKPEIYTAQIERVQQQAKKYLDFFGIELKPEQAAVLCGNDMAGMSEAIRADRERIKEEERLRAIRAEELRKKDFAKNLREFRSGKMHYPYLSDPTDGNNAYLRIFEDQLQTSKNIRMPLPVARRFYKAIMAKAKKPESLVGMKILDFEIVEHTKDYFRAGCHKITFKEVQRIAPKLGL